MRKTTIFRSSLFALIVLAAVSLPARAQQATTHVVVEGETLWGIAANYFGDPFLWPEIYRINTDVVEDPHWIFPGEQLRLQPQVQMAEPVAEEPVREIGEVQGDPEPELAEESIVRVAAPEVVGAAPPPPPPSEMAPTIFARVEKQNTISADFSGPPLRPVSRGTFYSAGFLTEGEMLPWGTITGVVGRATIAGVRTSTSALIYQEVEVTPPEGGSYAVGDSLLVVQMGRAISEWGNVVRPGGVLVVRRPADAGTVIAELVQQYHGVTDGNMVLPLEPFRDPGSVAPVPVESGLSGTIVAARDPNPVPGQQRVLFLDLGRADGVALGDVLVVEAPDPSGAEMRSVATVQVVHTRENSSSAIVMGIRDLGVNAGAVVRVVRKMPS
jgi:hypothetical protein